MLMKQLEKSTVAEYCIELRYKIDFHETTVLARSAGYNNRLAKEITEIRLHCSSFNRDGMAPSHQRAKNE
jgi:hypothetical protein